MFLLVLGNHPTSGNSKLSPSPSPSSWQYLAHLEIPTDQTFEKHRLGGFSGIYCEDDLSEDSPKLDAKNSMATLPATGFLSTAECYLVSDDRGTYGEPRVLKARIRMDKNNKIQFDPQKWLFIKSKSVSKDDAKDDTKSTSKDSAKTEVLDLEGLAPTPWNTFLLISEGDFNQKPRINPRLLEIKKDGSYVRDYEIPEEVIPEKTGLQKKGARNNRVFEGISKHPEDNQWVVSVEAPLLKSTATAPFYFYHMPQAWTITRQSKMLYPLDANRIEDLSYGVSDVLWLDPTKLLVLERGLGADLAFDVKIFQTELGMTDSIKKMKIQTQESELLQKQLVLDLSTMKDKIGPALANFEGIGVWPQRENEKKTNKKSLILVSDNNFKSYLKTVILILSSK